MLTNYGKQQLLNRLATGVPLTNLFIALGVGGFTPTLQVESISEPSFTNGYSRQQVPLRDVDTAWTVGQLDNHGYIESNPVTFEPTGAFSTEVNRLFLVDTSTSNVGNVLAVSSALATPILLGPNSDLIDRQFRFRIYL